MTSLSINKFETYLEHKGFKVRKIFKHQVFFLIEILSMNSGEIIMLSVPTQYYFEDSPSPDKIFACTPLEVKITRELDDYLTVSENSIYVNYNNTNISSSLPQHTTLGMDKYLDDTYKKSIIVEDVKDNDHLIAKTIHRQLHRLRYCIQGAQHKILIISGSVFGFLDDDYKIQMFNCERLSVSDSSYRKILIVVNLKHFYDKNDLIDHEVGQLYEGIYTILNNNQKVHLQNINTIVSKHTDLIKESSLSVHSSNLEKYILQYSDLLQELLVYEVEKKKEYVNLQKLNGGNIQAEMKRNHQKTIIEKELKKMNKAKEDIIKNLTALRLKYSTYTLEVDTILFDNIIMLDKIFKNFRLLSRIKE